MTIVLIGFSGWLLALLLPLTITLALRLRRSSEPATGASRGPRWRLHFWLGYGIAILTLLHAAIATGTGISLRVDTLGLYLATGALLLVVVQVFIGLLLREPSLRRRPVVRRWHLWVMAGVVLLAAGHIALNSVLLHGIHQ